jgi:hypothetical protein
MPVHWLDRHEAEQAERDRRLEAVSESTAPECGQGHPHRTAERETAASD